MTFTKREDLGIPIRIELRYVSLPLSPLVDLDDINPNQSTSSHHIHVNDIHPILKPENMLHAPDGRFGNR